MWDITTQEPVFYTEAPNTFDANTVRFHPIKKAIIVGTKRTLKLIAPCSSSQIHIDNTFTPMGHFLQAETSFSVRGAGKIFWAYDNKIIYHKYAKEQEISTENLGYSALFNSSQNIPQSNRIAPKNRPAWYLYYFWWHLKTDDQYSCTKKFAQLATTTIVVCILKNKKQ
ncbi:hypothetical protein [Aureispira anguillae]|uniref:Uncharacterized protein n=1 Tax=Aureispira anguillae TaxID=2864201 RepID=A0A915YBC7_9BACT|nr:hypothetical protein [Aureispira anguillae]BDS09950.1 hypothetical protein AsAng_0006550 [Aureispira anguillae]